MVPKRNIAAVSHASIRFRLVFLKYFNPFPPVSNKPDAQAKKTVEYVFGAGYFDTVIGEQEGVPKKPDPSGALKAAKICGADPSECLYFGDTNTDMKTGKNAKMTTVGVLWGFRGREELAAFQPEFLLEKPLDILTEIEK